MALSIVHTNTVFPCVPARVTGGKKLHRASPEVGVVDEVDAIHLTAPYCAVNVVVLNGTSELARGFSVKETVGAFVKPVVLQPEKVDPEQKVLVCDGLTDPESV